MTDALDPNKDFRVYGPAYGLWLVTAVLSVPVFLAGRALLIRTFVRFFPWQAWRLAEGTGSLSLANILISMPMAILVIAIIIGGFEYQTRNMGEPRAWTMLSRTLAVEIGILLLALFL